MQAQQHDDLSTMPAANLKSGRVQTMYEGNDPEEQNNNTPEETSEINEMEVLLRESATPITIKRGDVVEGVIVRIDQDEILVDIGLKSEGVLSTKELPAMAMAPSVSCTSMIKFWSTLFSQRPRTDMHSSH